MSSKITVSIGRNGSFAQLIPAHSNRATLVRMDDTDEELEDLAKMRTLRLRLRACGTD